MNLYMRRYYLHTPLLDAVFLLVSDGIRFTIGHLEVSKIKRNLITNIFPGSKSSNRTKQDQACSTDYKFRTKTKHFFLNMK